MIVKWERINGNFNIFWKQQFWNFYLEFIQSIVNCSSDSSEDKCDEHPDCESQNPKRKIIKSEKRFLCPCVAVSAAVQLLMHFLLKNNLL